jgi:hypothetical protein
LHKKTSFIVNLKLRIQTTDSLFGVFFTLVGDLGVLQVPRTIQQTSLF